MSMGGGAASGGGTGVGGTAYEPKQQGAADLGYQQIMQPMMGSALSSAQTAQQQGNPSVDYYPTAQAFVNQYMTQSPYDLWQALQAAERSANYGATELFPQAQGASSGLYNTAMGMLPYAGQALQSGFDPRYSSAIDQIENNPYYDLAQAGAQQGAAYGMGGASRMYEAGNQMMNTGFDPQSALFNRGQQQTLDRANAMGAMSGVGNTPYGAAMARNALTDYGLDWQDRQLGRQAQASSGAASLFGQAPGLASSSAAMPSNVYTNDINQLIQALNARNAAGVTGASGAGAIMNNAGSALTTGQNIGASGAEELAKLGAMPYQTGVGAANNALSGINQLSSLGAQRYQLPQSTLDYLAKYMGLGQNASALSGQLGNMGVQQQSNAIGGIGSLLGGLGGLGLGAYTLFSDRRLKTDDVIVGRLDNDLPVHLFRYKGDPTPRLGLMADEVERVNPHAIGSFGGFKTVDYGRAAQ